MKCCQLVQRALQIFRSPRDCFKSQGRVCSVITADNKVPPRCMWWGGVFYVQDVFFMDVHLPFFGLKGQKRKVSKGKTAMSQQHWSVIIKLFVSKLHQAASQKLEAHLAFASSPPRNLTVLRIICHFSRCIVFRNTLRPSHVNILSPHKVLCVIFKVSGSTVSCCSAVLQCTEFINQYNSLFFFPAPRSHSHSFVRAQYAEKYSGWYLRCGVIKAASIFSAKAFNVVLINIRDITVSRRCILISVLGPPSAIILTKSNS